MDLTERNGKNVYIGRVFAFNKTRSKLDLNQD